MNEEKDPVAELLRIAGPRPKVSPDAKARVFAAVRDDWRQSVRARRRTRMLGASGVAAAAAIVIAFVVLRPTHPATDTTAWGTARVRVDADARIQFVSDRIAVLEKGTLFVSTDHNHVEIRTPFGTVRDIGTKFEVRVADDLHVHVFEGLVDVEGTTVGAGGGLMLFRIEGLTLEQAVTRVAREKQLQVDWIDPSAKSKVLHGRVALTPDEALAAACSAAGVQYSINNGRLVIR
jgi:ferric-dicitrate binding protein FerR (iron transport regulator)